MGAAVVRAYGGAQAATRGGARCAARADRNPAAHGPGVRRRRHRATHGRALTMKPVSLMGALALSFLLAACGERSSGGDHDHADAHGHAQAEDVRKGEHGGRWLEQDGHAVELAIAEDGTPPKYQAWLYRAGKPLPPTAGTLEVHLVRLGDIAEKQDRKSTRLNSSHLVISYA